MLPNYYEFLNSVKLLSGNKALENIGYELSHLGSKKPIVITDRFLLQIGTVDTVKNAVGNQADLSVVFSDVPPDSSTKVVNEIRKIYEQNRCDGILAVGGGSVIDTSKGLKMLLSQEVDDIMLLMGNEIMKKGKKIPFIVVPTTSGTGSEATLVAVISNPDKGVKMEFISYELLPDAAVLDPRMTETLPPRLTASTGMDALCHAVEAYTCLQKNPMSDAYATTAIKLIVENLETAIRSGGNKSARLALANGSTLAGIAFSNSMVGLVHAIGHAAGGVAHVAHGDAMTILLPYVMEYNMEKLKDLYGELYLYLAGAEAYAATKKEDRGAKAVEAVRALGEKFRELSGLPTKFSEVKDRSGKQLVTMENIPEIAKKAINDGAIINNPVDAGEKEIIEILKRAY